MNRKSKIANGKWFEAGFAVFRLSKSAGQSQACFLAKVTVVAVDSANIAHTMANKNDFNQVFAKLKSILQPYVKKMDVAQDSSTYYLLNTRYIMKNKRPLCFGGVRLGKAYVSFYLMFVYACPDLLKSMSPELKQRMQGKSCFNFKEVDERLFKELKQLTKAGAAQFSDGKFIDGLRKMQAESDGASGHSLREARSRRS